MIFCRRSSDRSTDILPLKYFVNGGSEKRSSNAKDSDAETTMLNSEKLSCHNSSIKDDTENLNVVCIDRSNQDSDNYDESSH